MAWRGGGKEGEEEKGEIDLAATAELTDLEVASTTTALTMD